MAASSLSTDAAMLLKLAIGNAVTGLTVAFTPPSSMLRWALFPVQGLCLYAAARDMSQTNNVLATFVGGSVCAISLQYVEQVLLNQWDFETRGPTSALGGLKPVVAPATPLVTDNFWNRLHYASSMTLQHRYANTSRPVKSIPVFDPQNPQTVPSRGSFLGRTALQFFVLLLLLDANAYLPRDPNHELIFSHARTQLFSRWSEVTIEELTTRVAGVVMFAVYGYIVLEAQYHMIALVHVTSSLAEPADYPPLVGRLSQLYSLRQFWGTFWHQSFRRKLTSPAYFMTYVLIGLPRRSKVSFLLWFCLTFFLSGVLHAVGDVFSGYPWSESGALFFFCVQPLGLVLEAAVVAVHCAIFGRKFSSPPAWAKAVGRLYLFAWMVWVGPFYMWNTLRASEPGLLRFSMIGLFIK